MDHDMALPLLASVDRPSLTNYVEFLRCFRGRAREGAGSLTIDSDRAEFTMLLPILPEATDTIADFPGSVLALPWIAWVDAALAQSSRRKIGELVMMSKATAAGDRARTMDGAYAALAGVRRAQSTQDLEDFSLVQSRGFLEDPAEFADLYPWLRTANVRNEDNARCHFLLADLDGQPASVTLLVESDGACGIYAVATPPEHRRRGLSTALLSASETIAAARGHGAVTLQVYADTYAHGFYGRLGFREDYRIGLWLPAR